MMRRRFVHAALAAVLTLGVAAAQESGQRQFRFERAITAQPGANRLAIDVPLLVGIQPFTVRPRVLDDTRTSGFVAAGGLGDLRLFDQRGQEVQYLLISPEPAPDAWTSGRLLAIAATKTTSGFEVDLGEQVQTDRIRIEGLQGPFLKRAIIDGSGDRARWTMLAPQTTIFDLPGEGLRRMEVAVAPGRYRYFRVTWDDTNSAVPPLPSDVAARRVGERTVAAPPLTATLAVTRVASEPGRSRYRIALPAARLPIVAIEPRVDVPYVFREATITELRMTGSMAGPAPLGKRTLRRVVRDTVAAEEMAIPVSPPAEPEVDLTILDGDNPPLAITTATAHFAELPWITFQSSGGPLIARWGDPTLTAPRYDLEGARGSIAIGTLAEAAWGDVRTLTPPEASARPAPVSNVGAAIDVSQFRYARTIPPGDAGLIAVPLDPAVMAHSTGVRAQFADVRVVDDKGRQVPYVLEYRDAPLPLDLKIETREAPAAIREPSARSSRSFYRVRLPFANLAPWTLVLSTNASVFTRQVLVEAERPPDARHRGAWMAPLAVAQWVHTDPAKPARPLSLRGGEGHEADDLVVIVDEGDNSPLPLTSARLLLPSYRVRLYRDAGASLRLVYGHTALGPPSYDLALLSRSVLGAPAREVVADPAQAPGTARPAMPLGSPRVFWSVLVVAVLVLVALLVKLVRGATN